MTIRNLTSTPIRIDRYEIHNQHGALIHTGHLSHVKKNITSVFHKHKDPAFMCKAMDKVLIDLSPFQSCKANILKANPPQEILCVFFEIGGMMYQSNIIHPRCHSQYLMAVNDDPDPPCKHITFYHPEHHHLIIAYRNSYRAWMKFLRDDTPLSALSIPGTHNSPTYHHALPSVRCQVVPVREQLKRGVRFLDVRVQPEHPENPKKDGLRLVHGAFPVSLTGPRHFKSTVTEVLDFLANNSSETVIMCVKREGTGSSTDAQLSRILRDHYAGDVTRWFTAPRVPYLGEARGKIVLVRRFHLDDSLKGEWGGEGWCIDADAWADNSPHSLCPSGDICIQDFYEVLDTHNITEKIQYSIEHLQRAAERVCPQSEHGKTSADVGEKQPFYINFLTASNFWKVGCWPDRIAAKLNPAIVEYLCIKHNEITDPDKMDTGQVARTGDGSTGIVVCDWVGHNGDWDIVRCIVGYNAKYEKAKPL